MENNTILVIEDNKMNMKLVRSLLQLRKVRVFEAEDAEMGILMAEKNLPDLILMDVQLPGMDGLAATRLIKHNPSLKHIPVVALTSHAMRGDEEKARDAGCDGYISKPIDTRGFLDTLARYLKNQQDDCQENKMQPETMTSDERKPKILIVDDELMNVKLMRAILATERFEIFEAHDGVTALRITEEVKVDLILLDVMMPGMDGYEVTQILKNSPQSKSIPVILVTALSGRDDKMRGLEVGADEFLTKPVNKIEILARVRSMLQLRQYEEQMNVRVRSEEAFSVRPVDEGSPKKQKIRPRVLLVEDNEKDIKLIQNLIGNESYEVILTRSGEEAIEIAQRERIDLILQDILLPGMNGFEVCHYLKNKKETCDIQIVMITCLNDLESKLKGVEQGVDDFLVKPIDSRELKSRINVLLKKKAYLDELHSHYDKALSLAISDGLTGLYNQGYFKRYLDLEIERSLKQGYPVGLVMIDLDDFKKYNDFFGHAIGDVVLQEFARIIRANVREIDLSARYGGEEFAVVFPYAERENILRIIERIRDALRDHRFPEKCISSLGNVTASIGVAFCPANAITAEDLIEKADYMLYRAKKSGKNRVCIFNS